MWPTGTPEHALALANDGVPAIAAHGNADAAPVIFPGTRTRPCGGPYMSLTS